MHYMKPCSWGHHHLIMGSSEFRGGQLPKLIGSFGLSHIWPLVKSISHIFCGVVSNLFFIHSSMSELFSNSGRLDNPPQIPDSGLFSSKILFCVLKIMRFNRWWGLSLAGFLVGNWSCWFICLASHLLLSGQFMQSGFVRVQSVAPRSIIACV